MMNSTGKLLKTATIALGIWGASALQASALPLLYLSETQAGNVVSVSVSESGATDLYGYQFSLNFNPAVLHASTVAEGSFLSTAGATFFDAGTTDNVAGSVSFVFDTLLSAVSGATGNGVLAVINFNVQQWHTTTQLTLSDVLAVDSNLNVLSTQTQGLAVTIPEPATLALLSIGVCAMMLGVSRHDRDSLTT